MSTYSFDFDQHRLTISREGDQVFAKATLKVTSEFKNGRHDVVQVLYKDRDVKELLQVFAPAVIGQILLYGVSNVYRVEANAY